MHAAIPAYLFAHLASGWNLGAQPGVERPAADDGSCTWVRNDGPRRAGDHRDVSTAAATGKRESTGADAHGGEDVPHSALFYLTGPSGHIDFGRAAGSPQGAVGYEGRGLGQCSGITPELRPLAASWWVKLCRWFCLRLGRRVAATSMSRIRLSVRGRSIWCTCRARSRMLI